MAVDSVSTMSLPTGRRSCCSNSKNSKIFKTIECLHRINLDRRERQHSAPEAASTGRRKVKNSSGRRFSRFVNKIPRQLDQLSTQMTMTNPMRRTMSAAINLSRSSSTAPQNHEPQLFDLERRLTNRQQLLNTSPCRVTLTLLRHSPHIPP